MKPNIKLMFLSKRNSPAWLFSNIRALLHTSVVKKMQRGNINCVSVERITERLDDLGN